jgi:hypothetical protein
LEAESPEPTPDLAGEPRPADETGQDEDDPPEFPASEDGIPK